jgi:Na+-driven multidrug efflux pump
MNQIALYFKILVVLTWFLGFFAPLNVKIILWAIPAGWAAGTVIAELIFYLKK